MSLYAFILLSTLLVITMYFTYLCPGNSIPTTNSLYNAWEQLSTNALLIFDYPVASNAVVFRSYWIQLAETKKHDLRLYHIKFHFLYSTDEYLKRLWFVFLLHLNESPYSLVYSLPSSQDLQQYWAYNVYWMNHIKYGFVYILSTKLKYSLPSPRKRP